MTDLKQSGRKGADTDVCANNQKKCISARPASEELLCCSIILFWEVQTEQMKRHPEWKMSGEEKKNHIQPAPLISAEMAGVTATDKCICTTVNTTGKYLIDYP